MERRYNSHASVSLRNDGNDAPTIIEGYAAVYYDGTRDTEFELWPGVLERIMPGAFDKNLDDDVRALFNHKAELVLGRNVANTLRLSVDSRGLRYSIDAADTTVSRDVMEHLRRGDVSGSSFAFQGAEADWLYDAPIADGEYSADIRQINSFSRLLDVGPVTYPAYAGSSSGARSADSFPEVRDELSAAREERSKAASALRSRYAARAALAEVESA